jgi:2-C-methyl-D-erythritol 4-phosphate cytidylyltransferase
MVYMTDPKKYAVIVAGGKGARMGSDIPKQFLHLLGKPLLCYPILAFAQAIPGIELIVVLPEDQLRSAEIVIKSYLNGINVTVVVGGGTRYHSVRNGLKKVKDDGGIVFVHDGARPLLSKDLILRTFWQAMEKGSAIPTVPVTDSMRLVDGGSSKPLDRAHLRVVQTPQTFKTGIILPAFEQPYHPSFTDEATVVEAFGKKVYLIDGDWENIKVTTPGDMILADALLRSREKAKPVESSPPE